MADIQWLGHAGIKLKGAGKAIYIDPWKLKDAEPADIVLVTHSHYDHCSAVDIKKIKKPATTIIGPPDSIEQLSGNTKSISPGEKLNIEGVKIEAVPAYNVNKNFHPKSSGGVGYIINVEGQKIYHAGDTDFIPEMKGLKADIAILPVGGTYTMNAKEAAQAANLINPKIAIPVHYGSIVGTTGDADEFKRLCNVEVQILSK